MQPVLTLTGSMSTSSLPSQTLSFDETLFEYHPNHSSRTTCKAGGFIGEEYSFNRIIAWQFGLGLYQVASSSINGEETQAPTDNLNAINFWNYHYKRSSRQLLFENKLLFTMHARYHPYLLAGFGESFNHAYAFHVTAKNSGEVATAIFADHKNQSFIYTIGAGLDIDVYKKIRIGVGYRFANLGKYDLGKGTLDTGVGGNVFLIPALKSPDSFNHELLIQLTYLI